MKAKIIRCTSDDSGLGGNFIIDRILIPDANNLAVTIISEEALMLLWDNFEEDEYCTTIREIDIPDDIVREFTDFLAQKNLLAEKAKVFLGIE